MQEPTQTDKELYPNLTQRDDWPPKEVPTHDMKLAEREELHRYWQDQKLERIEEQELVPPEYEARSLELDIEQTSELQQDATYIPQDDRASRHELYKQDLAMDAARRERIERSQKDVYIRATHMNRSSEENELLDIAAQSGPQAVQSAKDIIMLRRIERIQVEDNRQLIRDFERAMEPSFKERIKAFMGTEQEKVADLPVPGPYNDPHHPEEIEEEIERMVQSYEREQERER